MNGLFIAAVIIVRLYNYSGVPAPQLVGAEAEAAAIFEKSGISVLWHLCRVGGSEIGDACLETLGGNERIIRLMGSSIVLTRGSVSMGAALIESDSGRGVLATIDPALAMGIAQQAGVDTAVMLGRAMAHELGHLLLATTSHSQQGLMRALWTQAELHANRGADWTFSSSEGETMRRTMARSHMAN